MQGYFTGTCTVKLSSNVLLTAISLFLFIYFDELNNVSSGIVRVK
jgi:hypothetical protein